MSKKVQKTLTGAMAAMMATGVVATPAMAETNTTDVDALYKAAYAATEKALNEKTQASINEAREAIDALPKDLDWAIGEFSKQVDTVQHPILVDIIKAIETAQASKSQADINAAKEAIPSDLFDIWKNSYSSAVDKIQQELQKQALDAIELAKETRKAEDIDAAKTLVADILTSNDAAMVEWAKLLEADINAVSPYDVVVTKVDNISITGVKVSFDALKDALRDVTVEVIDNEGNLVKVDAKKVLIEGETSASFTFTTALRNRPEGIWTVNGVELNLDAVNLVDDVKAAKGSDALYSVLKDTTLVSNVKKANVQAYLDEIKASENISTVEDLQKLIDKVNEEVSAKADVEYLVEMANKGTDNQFKNALLAMNLEKVNTSWLDDYRKEVKDDVTLEDVKNSIKTANNRKLVYDQESNLVNGKLDETKIANNIELVEEYYVFDSEKEDEVKSKEDILNSHKIDLAIANVNNADTQASLKSALLNLEKAVNNKNTFEYSKLVNEDILSKYVVANKGNAKSVQDVITVLATGYENALSEAISNIATKAEVIVKAGEKVTDAQKQELLNAYANLAKVTAKASVKFDNSKVKAELAVEYAREAKNTDNVEMINAYIKTVNENIVATTLNKVGTGENQITLLQALKELGIKNLVNENEESYEAVYADAAKPTSDWTVALLQNKIDAANSLVNLLASNNVTTVKNELTNIALKDDSIKEFINEKDLEKQDIAEVLVKLIADKKFEITNLSELRTAVYDDAKSANNLVNGYVGAFNTTTSKENLTIDGTKSALENVSAEYKALDGVTKVAVAEKFNANRATKKDGENVVLVEFTNLTEIRTLLAECMK